MVSAVGNVAEQAVPVVMAVLVVQSFVAQMAPAVE